MAPEEWVLARLRALGVRPEDVLESFTRSGGAGGQNVNKVSSAVILRHPPTGTVVRCEESRSQAANRELAWRRLADAMEEARRAREAARRDALERERRRRRPKPRRLKERILESKKHRAKTKQNRGRVDW
ncbi:MAG: peptide chain release factor-like protein [Elusimicrobia bacterium]|nr:peptide chain release factor-like protein [Elusimicrobiota bacterium]